MQRLLEKVDWLSKGKKKERVLTREKSLKQKKVNKWNVQSLIWVQGKRTKDLFFLGRWIDREQSWTKERKEHHHWQPRKGKWTKLEKRISKSIRSDFEQAAPQKYHLSKQIDPETKTLRRSSIIVGGQPFPAIVTPGSIEKSRNKKTRTNVAESVQTEWMWWDSGRGWFIRRPSCLSPPN
jgi:hypothetical protein